MKGVQLTLEGLAARVRRDAGAEPDEAVSSLAIARRVMGRPVVILESLPTRACLVLKNGAYTIVVREIDDETHFAVAHELGHWALRTIAQYRGADEERYANYIAGAITAPMPVVREAMGKPRPIKPLARTSGITHTAAALRIAEATGRELVVVTGEHGYVMLPSFTHEEGLRWAADEAHVRRVALGEERDPRLETERLAGRLAKPRVAVKLR